MYLSSKANSSLSTTTPNSDGAIFRPFPFRRSWIPKFVPFDFGVAVRQALNFTTRKEEPLNNGVFWDSHFNLHHRVFRQQSERRCCGFFETDRVGNLMVKRHTREIQRQQPCTRLRKTAAERDARMFPNIKDWIPETLDCTEPKCRPL